ncbi:MAG: hypothetical protein NC418_10070 [Muribaculaceae bacterium]|nr:hypothetical protein [Muribaculaceae bacterium]
MKKHLICTLMLSAALGLSAATVRTQNGKLTYTSDGTDASGSIGISFARCMANNLFTFSSITVDGTEVNHTDSDNIGPFLIPSGWTGGNHTNPSNGTEMRSARTESVEVELDGKPLDITKRQKAEGDVLTIKVVNTLLMPASETRVFARETMTYTVAGNSVEIYAQHEYMEPLPQLVDRYYGMQSMFMGETEILTPGGEYFIWTPVAGVNRFSKASAPNFCTFVEHSPTAYQAAWMDRSYGLGSRNCVADDDVVFIGNSYTKSYHKLMGSYTVHQGDVTRWHGIYTWFKTPETDECRAAAPGVFAYRGYSGGKPALFSIDAEGHMTISGDESGITAPEASEAPFAKAGKGTIEIAGAPHAAVYSLAGSLIHSGEGIHSCEPGIYIATDGRGSSLKLYVK